MVGPKCEVSTGCGKYQSRSLEQTPYGDPELGLTSICKNSRVKWALGTEVRAAKKTSRTETKNM